jgi:multiple sugar transport system permease protein
MTKKKRNPVAFVLAVMAVFMANFPILWIVLVAFKPKNLLFERPLSLVFRPTLRNFIGVLSQQAIVSYLANSLLVASATTAVTIAISFLAAYSMARYRTGGKGMPFMLLTMRTAPAMVFIIPFIVLFSFLNLVDRPIGLIVAHLVFTLPFATWVLKSFVEEMPKELEEAALIDGCTVIQVIWKVTLRLSIPAIVAVGILVFVESWNEFLFALILTLFRSRTWTVGAGVFVAMFDIDYSKLAAVGVLGMILPVVLVFLVQKHLVRGLTFGVLKG